MGDFRKTTPIQVIGSFRPEPRALKSASLPAVGPKVPSASRLPVDRLGRRPQPMLPHVPPAARPGPKAPRAHLAAAAVPVASSLPAGADDAATPDLGPQAWLTILLRSAPRGGRDAIAFYVFVETLMNLINQSIDAQLKDWSEDLQRLEALAKEDQKRYDAKIQAEKANLNQRALVQVGTKGSRAQRAVRSVQALRLGRAVAMQVASRDETARMQGGQRLSTLSHDRRLRRLQRAQRGCAFVPPTQGLAPANG